MIKDTSRILNAGGFALIVAGDSQSFQNISDKPATYYVLSFKSKNPVNIQRGNQEGGSIIKDWNELAVTQTDIGESGQAFDKSTSMFVRFNIIAINLNPGMISHLPHTHRAEEIILVIKGDVQMQIAEGFHNSTAGDIIFLEANVPHALKNTGSKQCSYYSIQWHN